MSTTSVREAYSRLADRYIDLFGSVDGVDPQDLALIARHLGRVPGPVLDLGCGPGHLTGFLRSMQPDVTGIDLVPEFVAHARRHHPGARFRLGSLTDLDHPDGSVGGILAWYSLVHLPPAEFDGVLAGFRRVLAPGGALVVGFFDGDDCEPFAHKVTTAHRWPVDEVARRLARAGLAEVERLRRGQEGERRPHGVVAARAVRPALLARA
ncbi:class I SAM-dependent DNA methyltransferase [Kineococcus glutinatus]|uniref:Class I SAM-dependent methyltransferase n=1 Tax=Kineococcus glutinatus TaxID=1070872 RepID=A0ABP9HAX9_9ACTN